MPSKSMEPQFVNITSSRLGPADRRAIRSHAMQVYRRQKRQAKHEDRQAEFPASGSTGNQAPGRKLRVILPSLQPCIVPGSAGLDPFDSLPCKLTASLEKALRLSYISLDAVLLPAHAQSTVQLQLLGPMLLEGMIQGDSSFHAVAGFCLVILRNSAAEAGMVDKIHREALHHKGEAFQALRQNIASMSVTGRRNSLQNIIASIAWLLPLEVMTLDLEAYHKHAQILRLLIKDIGGLSKIGSFKWCFLDTSARAATFYFSGPIFDLDDLGIPLDRAVYINFERLSEDTLLEVIAELHHLRDVAKGLKSSHAAGGWDRVKIFLEKRTLIEHCLSSLQGICQGPSEVFRKVLLTYVDLQFRTIVFRGTTRAAHLYNIRAAILEVGVEAFHDRMDWLLWILYTCGSVVPASELRAWFLLEAGKATRSLKLRTFDEVRAVLDAIALAEVYEDCGRIFYEDMYIEPYNSSR